MRPCYERKGMRVTHPGKYDVEWVGNPSGDIELKDLVRWVVLLLSYTIFTDLPKADRLEVIELAL
jgi:hypothetical protein